MSLRYLDINPTPISEEGLYSKTIMGEPPTSIEYRFIEGQSDMYYNGMLQSSTPCRTFSNGCIFASMGGTATFYNSILKIYSFAAIGDIDLSYSNDIVFMYSESADTEVSSFDDLSIKDFADYFSCFAYISSGITRYIGKKNNKLGLLVSSESDNTFTEYNGTKLVNLEGKDVSLFVDTSDNALYVIFKVGKILYRYNILDTFVDDNIVLWGVLPEDIENFSIGSKLNSSYNYQELYLIDFVKHQYYTATLTDTPPTPPTPPATLYTIRFLNYDGSELEVKQVEEGTTPSYTGTTPSREGYTFTGWTPSLAPATQDQDYTATFVINKYTIRFLQDGQVLATKQVEYNQMPVYDGETPQKEGYRFDKWSPDIKVATQDQDYVALFVRQYVIRFLNYDNSVLQSSKIDENTMPEFSGVEPTREHYNFIGWTPEIAIATQDQDYIATFEAIKYKIRFLNGTLVLQDTMVSYGEIPTYTGEEPTKEGHTFIGWSPTIYAVDKNQDYQATFSINTYLITFASEDGIPLETKEVEYGETPEYTGEEPTKEGYVFLGWTPTPYPANKNQTYTPRFRINSFTIRFLGENGEVLQEETLEYGATPVYKGATPTKEHYDFAGWTPEIYPVNRNQDYKVKFTEHYYTITLLNEDGSLFTTVKALFGDPLDSLPTPEPEQEGYVFDKWLPDIQAVSGDATYTASFRIATFTIRFLNYDGSVLQSEVLEYGATPVYKEDTPIKVGSTFLGWKPEIYSVNKDQDYTAQFSVATHNLVFKANGETLWQITYQGELTKIEVNTLVNLTLSFTDNKGKSSKQISDFENTTNISGFTINGQNYSVNKTHNVSYDSDIEANLTFYSTQHYRIRWSVDGTFQTEYSQIVESGTIPTYNGPTPSKEGHTFLGWSPTPYPADKNQDYTAILRSNDAFTITVRDSENKELSQTPDNNHDFGSDLIITKLRFKQSRIIPYGQMISIFFNENAIADLLVSYDPEYNVEVNSVVIGDTTYFITSDDDEKNLSTPLQSSFEMIFYTRETYHIRFLDEDGTLLYQTYVSLNEIPRYVGELPSNKDENYVFAGWTPSLAPATQDQDYTAVYEWAGYKITSITNTLDIPITNELPLLIHNQEVGATVNKVSVRSGIGDVEITFYFAKNHVDGTQYSEKFTLTYDRNYLTQNNLNLPYTEEVVIDGNTIAADGEKHDIEFVGGASISIEIHNKKTYLTRFLNYNHTVLYSTLTVDGETPVYVGDTPTREDYIFVGWTPTPYPADKNQDYIARFNVDFEIMYESTNGTLKSYNAVRIDYKNGTSKTFTKARFDKKENN